MRIVGVVREVSRIRVVELSVSLGSVVARMVSEVWNTIAANDARTGVRSDFVTCEYNGAWGSSGKESGAPKMKEAAHHEE